MKKFKVLVHNGKYADIHNKSTHIEYVDSPKLYPNDATKAKIRDELFPRKGIFRNVIAVTYLIDQCELVDYVLATPSELRELCERQTNAVINKAIEYSLDEIRETEGEIPNLADEI